MNLRLQYPPTPEHAVKHAQAAVEAAWNVEGIRLDYSPESLTQVDRVLGRFHADGMRSGPILTLVFCFGCYFGEVFVRHHRADWKMPADTTLPEELKEGNNMRV